MSKQLLEKALKSAIDKTANYRKNIVDKYEHYYYVDAGTITREILNAVHSFTSVNLDTKAAGSLRALNASKLSAPVNTYVKELFTGFTSSSKDSSVLFDITKGGPPTFVVRCYENPRFSGRTKTVKGKKGKSQTIRLQADFYRAINKIRTKGVSAKTLTDEKDLSSTQTQSPLDTLRLDVLRVLFNIVNITDSSGIQNAGGKDLFDVVLGAKKKGKREGGLLHLGHLEGFAVVEKRALEVHKLVTEEIGVTLGSASLEKILYNKKTALSKSKMGQFLVEVNLPENFTIVMDEDATGNISKEQERELLKTLTTELLSNKWAEQEGSMKPVGALVYDLQETIEESIKSIKPKRSNKPKGKRNATPTKTKKIPIKGTAKVTRSSGKESFPDSSGNATIEGNKAGSVNWSSLIRIINIKLPETVRKNMQSPALNNRTGRFANSAEVLNIETTREGYPSIIYDYSRNPYNVFDRSIGRSPWNTPERDPRTLVDKSIREIVQELAIGRFYTRRA